MRAMASLTATLERSLLAYVTAAGAAGTGIMALPSLAEAKVVYTSAHVVLKTGDIYRLDLNHDGITDFVLNNSAGCWSSGCAWNLLAESRHSNAVRGKLTQPRYGALLDSALFKGTTIGRGDAFYKGGGFMVGIGVTGGGTHTVGRWVNVNNRYLGLRFHIGSDIHYGWARLSVTVQGFDIKALLTGYAYETTPNKAIIAGNRGSTTGQGPEAEPASLGHLALGAAGRKQHHQGELTSH